MNAPSEKECREVRRLVGKWQKRMGLSHMQIFVIFAENPPAENPDAPVGPVLDGAMASTQSEYPYFRAEITIHPGYWIPKRAGEREFTIVHELMHVATWPLIDVIERLKNGHMVTDQDNSIALESTTELLANMLLRRGGVH